jgi:hypothetical protein
MSDLKLLLHGIYVQRGQLDGETVVAEATPQEHPLHNYFEWDDNKAGHKYRVHQAEKLIRRVKVESAPPSADDGPHYVRAFVSNRQAGIPDRNGYSPIEEVVSDPLQYQMLLRSLQRQVNELQRRFGHLKEFGATLRASADEAS